MQISIAEKIKNFIKNKELTFGCCILSVIILPVNVFYLPPVMILWGLSWLWENNFRIKQKMFLENKASVLFLLFVVFFLWQISGLLNADSIGIGFERIFKRLSFVFFPLVLFYPGKKIIRDIKWILVLFSTGTFIYMIYCLGNALHNSISILNGKFIFNPHPADYNYENFFIGFRLSAPLHPSYLSMYIVLSILISLESVIDSSHKLFKRGLWLVLILFFLLMLYLLSSRAGMLSAIIVLPAYLLYQLSLKFPKWIIYLSSIAIILIFLKIAWTNDKLYYEKDGITKSQPSEILKNDERYNIWRSAIGVIKHNLILGVGTGDATDELKKEFMRRGYVDGYYDNLNAHNQYIEILLENGIIGLALFLGILGYMIFIAISEQNLIYGLYILMMMIFFFFESNLNRLAGVAFFPLFSFLLIYLRPPHKISG
jgi:O-antigen ligase